MTVDQIKAAIQELPASDQAALVDWLEDLRDQAWDREIERDFAPGGRGIPFLEEVQREIAEGKATPMDEGWADHRRR